ncbi:MAG: ABC transporter ATP-binding protein [Verrucomicrobiae bacterium]|nr:ABC transporter ATP-binding protein [Verrucomicrobiae bacterium]
MVLENISKTFGTLKAVDHLSLEVPEGQFLAFLGPNGAGKTTTIKMLVGLLKPTSGRALLGGHDMQSSPVAAKKLISYVPDFPFLYDKLTVVETLDLTARIYGLDGAEGVRLRDYWIDYLFLGEYRHELIENLSHGTRQRVVFASAFLHSPKIMIVDEPMVGLDPKIARVIKDTFKDFARKGTTVFMSTHVLSVAEELADRIAIIQHGRMLALGTLQELRTRTGEGGALEKSFLALTDHDEPVPPAEVK